MTPHEQKLIPAAAAFRKALLAWFARHQRPLPWRTDVSAYRTVVSELMCQQTQIATALPYFERWVARWPDFQSLARAKEADVLAAWAGLGYYTRARNLLALAQQVAGRPEPRTAAAWLAFKGVGPYTAAAIASIAFREPVAVVDGNVVRVLARVGGVRTRFKDTTTAAKSFTPLANALVDPKRPGDHNQAMMELGQPSVARLHLIARIVPSHAGARWVGARKPRRYHASSPRCGRRRRSRAPWCSTAAKFSYGVIRGPPVAWRAWRSYRRWRPCVGRRLVSWRWFAAAPSATSPTRRPCGKSSPRPRWPARGRRTPSWSGLP